MKITCCRSFLLASLLVLAFATRGQAAQELLTLMPSESVMVLHVHDVPQLLEAWQRSPFLKFFQDSRTTKLFQPLRLEFEAYKSKLEATRGVSLNTLLKFFDGELVLAAIPAPPLAEGGLPVEWILAFEHNGDPEVLKALRQSQAGRTMKQHAGLSYFESSVTGATSSGSSFMIHDHYGSRVVVHAGGRGTPILGVLGAMAGEPKDGGFAVTKTRTRYGSAAKSAPLEIFLRLPTLVSWLTKSGLKGDWARQWNLNGLKLDEVEELYVAAHPTEDALDASLVFYIPPPRKGIARAFFCGKPAPFALVERLPADTLAYSASKVELEAMWQVLLESVHGSFPAVFQLLQSQLLQLEQNQGLSVERDLLAPFSGEIVKLQYLDEEARQAQPMTTYLLDVKTPDALRRNLETLLRYGAAGFGAYHSERHDLSNGTLWQLYAGLAGEVTSNRKPFFYLFLTDSTLVATADRACLEALVKSWSDPASSRLVDSAPYGQVMTDLPDQRVSESFADAFAFERQWASRFKQINVGGKRQELWESGLNRRSAGLMSEFFGYLRSVRYYRGEGQLCIDARLQYPTPQGVTP